MSANDFLVNYQTAVGGPCWGIEPAGGPLVKPLFDDKRVKVFTRYELKPEHAGLSINALLVLIDEGKLLPWFPPPRERPPPVTGEICGACYGFGFVRVAPAKRLEKRLCPKCSGVGRIGVAA